MGWEIGEDKRTGGMKFWRLNPKVKMWEKRTLWSVYKTKDGWVAALVKAFSGVPDKVIKGFKTAKAVMACVEAL